MVAAILVLLSSLNCSSPIAETPLAESCEPQIDNFSAALNIYMGDVNNRDKCIAVKQAGATLLDCPSLSPGQKANYKDTIDGIFCD